MNRVQAGVLVLLVLLAAAPVATAVTGGQAAGSAWVGGGPAAAANGPGPSDAAAVEADLLEFRITVHENASARWTFTYTRMLDNETERDRFRSFADEFERTETEAYREFQRQAEGLASSGANATGREMTAVDFSRSAELGGNCVTSQDCGTVTMSFTWTDFAAVEDDELVVGDVFGSGLYLSGNQQLVFEAGEGLAFASASPDSFVPEAGTLEESRSITYEGEQSFSDGRPRVTFVSDDGGPVGDGEDGGTGTDGPASPGEAGGLPLALIGGLLVLVVGTAAAIIWWRDGDATLPFGGPDDAGGAAAESTGDDTADVAVPEEELLTDEDRVLKLLEENGGRMKQVAIVDETGWSKSKVSMLLSDMEEDDQISKLRVGRENIISLAGHEPEAAGSPHEED